MKNSLLGLYIPPQYTIKVMFHNPGNFCNYKISEFFDNNITLFERFEGTKIIKNAVPNSTHPAVFAEVFNIEVVYKNIFYGLCLVGEFEIVKKLLNMLIMTYSDLNYLYDSLTL